MLRHFNDALIAEELHDAFGMSALMPVQSRKRARRTAKRLRGRSFVDLTITASAVVPATVSGYANQFSGGTAGETLTQGLLIYKKASDGLYYKADNNDVTDSPVGEVATIAGVTINSALAGQPITFQTAGILAFGAILTKGTDYILSSTAGGIAPIADYGSGKYNSKIGIGYSTTQMWILISNTGIKSA